jgi:hypothetical protein
MKSDEILDEQRDWGQVGEPSEFYVH